MVFSGQPSTGCQMCRTRRIKCDEAKPACSQCVRTDRTCPGYKSKIDLLFRNETGASAAIKHNRAAARKKAGALAAAGPSTQSRNPTSSSSASQSQNPSLSLLPISAPASQAAAQAASLYAFSVSEPSMSQKPSVPIASSKQNSQTRKLATAADRKRAVASSNQIAGRNSSSGPIEEEEVERYFESTLPNSQIVQRRQHHGNVEVILPALAPPPDDLAINHFLANFVMVSYEDPSRSYFNFLIPLMHQVNSPVASRLTGLGTFDKNSAIAIAKPPSEGSLALSYAFFACALASIGTRVTSIRYPFLEKAVGAYTRALAATHSALRDPDLSRADSTLAAVLLLGIFENITAKQLGLFAWGSHIEGAIEIVKRRSNEQRLTRTGRSLFAAVRTQMIIHSLATGKTSGMGCEWWFKDAVVNEVAAQSQRLSVRAAELRAEVTTFMERVSLSMAQKPPEVMAEVRAMAERAHALDRECAMWMENRSAEWSYYPVAWQDKLPEGRDYRTAEVFPGYVDVYPDLHVAGCWNMVRSTRLCISSIGARCAAWACWPADYCTTPEFVAAEAICKDMIRGIIASVPFHLGYQSRYSPLGRGGQGEGWTWLRGHESASAHAAPEAFSPAPPRHSATSARQGGPAGQASATARPTTTAVPPIARQCSAYSTSTHTIPSTVPPQTTSPPAAAEFPESTSSSSMPSLPHEQHQQHQQHPRQSHSNYRRPGHKEYVPVAPKPGYMLGDATEVKGLSGYFLAWPLLNVASQDQTTDEQRAWVVGRLKYISEAMGVRYAGFLSSIQFRAPSMLIRRDRAVAQHALRAATGQIGKGDPVASPFIEHLGIKTGSIRGDSPT